MSKTVSLLVIFIISIVILIGLVRQIKDALEAGSRLDTATDEVNSLQAENRALKQKLENLFEKIFLKIKKVLLLLIWR